MPNVIDELVSMWNPTVERCGIILEGGEVVEVLNYAVMLSGGHSEFAMRVGDVMEAAGDAKVVGVFHTHPRNTCRPSKADIAGWPEVEEYYIVTELEVMEWKLVGDRPVLVARTKPEMADSVRQAPANSR